MYDLSDLPQATKPGTKSLGKKFRNYGKHYIDKCEDCMIAYCNPNFLSYFGVGYIAFVQLNQTEHVKDLTKSMRKMI